MYLKINFEEKQYTGVEKEQTCNIFGCACGSIKVHLFGWKKFKPIYMPMYTRLECITDGFKMVDYYDYGFKEEIVRYRLIEKKDISLCKVKRIIESDKIYWFERYGRRKAHMIITEKFTI